MDGPQLAQLVDQRFNLISVLVDLTEQQFQAISAGHMSNLMSILDKKQQPLNQLSQLSKQLTESIGFDPDLRSWPNEQARTECRDQHDRCEQLLAELLLEEKKCEEQLLENRSTLQTRLDRSHETGRAIKSYANVAANFKGPSPANAPSGARLDLSSQ